MVCSVAQWIGCDHDNKTIFHCQQTFLAIWLTTPTANDSMELSPPARDLPFVTVHQKQGMAAYIVTVTVHRVPQMRESGLRCVLVHMSRPLTKQMGAR